MVVLKSDGNDVPRAVQRVSELFGLELKGKTGLISLLLHSVISNPGRNEPDIYAEYETVREAKAAVDALAKQLYHDVFKFIVALTNNALLPRRAPPPGAKFIGVLDIFGFEIFKVNSFSQLLINYANEMLQSLFNEHIFKREVELYVVLCVCMCVSLTYYFSCVSTHRIQDRFTSPILPSGMKKRPRGHTGSSSVSDDFHDGQLRVHCVTWNVNANQPSSLSKVRELLVPNRSQIPDLIAVSIQELVKLNVENVVITGDLSMKAGTSWLGLLSSALKSVNNNCFMPLIAKHCVGMLLLLLFLFLRSLFLSSPPSRFMWTQ